MTKAENADFKAAIELAKEAKDTFPDLARCLAKSHARDPSTIKRFAEESKVEKRKAYYLLELGKKLPDLRISDERLRKIGWTKLVILIEKLDGRDAVEWLKLAETHSTQELKALVRDKNPSSKDHCVQLYFTPNQYRQLERAILDHGGKRSGRGLINKEDAIMKMVRKLCPAGSNHIGGTTDTILRSGASTA